MVRFQWTAVGRRRLLVGTGVSAYGVQSLLHVATCRRALTGIGVSDDTW